MEDNNIIICEKCYEENEATRTNCKNCGAKLYNNDNEKHTNTQKKITSSNDKDYQKKTTSSNDKDYQEKPKYICTKTNAVAQIIKVIAIIEAIVIVIVGLVSMEYLETMSVVIIVAGVISAVFIYALGEIIQLLQDIKDKN